jgi:putative flippase GtrA
VVRSGGLRTLTRASAVALIVTLTELAILPLFIYVFGIPREVSYFEVQLLGNLLSFILNKYWAFDAAQVGQLEVQYVRQLVLFGGSLLLNTVLPSFMSYQLGIEPVLAFALSNPLVYFTWNYPGNRFWVFRRSSASNNSPQFRMSK